MLTVLLALSGIAEATNVTVPTQQPTISAAVASLVGPGPHTIQIVVDNTYVEPDTVDTSNMDVTIVGTGSATTIVRVGNPLANTVFRTNNGRLVLDRITVSGDVTNITTGLGLVDNICSFADNRRGVVATSSTVEVYEAEMRCFFSQGAGAAISGITSDIVIDGATFEQNIALGSGGHVFAGGSTASPPTVNITNTDFRYGFSISDGGAISVGNVEAHIARNSFFYNDSIIRGGAVSIQTSAVATTEVWENTFQGNQAIADLGFEVFDFGEQFATGSVTGVIDFDFVVGDGGGLYVDGEDVDVWANLFCGNYSDIGGGLFVEKPPLSTVENNIFTDNWAGHYGGGLYVNAASGMADPEVWNNTFYANAAGSLPPPLGGLGVYGGGGAAFFDGTNVDFRNNAVSHHSEGGGIGGVDGENFIIGDPLSIAFNLFFQNNDAFVGGADLTADYAAHTLNQTNVIGMDPFPTFGAYGDLDCYPEAFYPEWGSPTINRGDDTDPMWADIDGTRNDIGFTGGSRAPTLDRDNDGYMNTIDCNDLDPAVNPNANEVCDLQDNDCDGEVDEGSPNTWYEDADGDGYGTIDPSVQVLVQCAPPAGYVSLPGDCDDNDASVNPGQYEICDLVDNDCNGTVDDEDVLDFKPYYRDADGDGYGQSQSFTEACASPGAGFTDVSGDCNDNEPGVFPGATEACDQLDNDCNGLIDDNAPGAAEWFLDEDGDGYGVGTPIFGCEPPGTASYVNFGGDCADTDAAINPMADEICDLVDNDCDGNIDDDPSNDPNAIEVYEDADGDGFLDEETKLAVCPDAEIPTGYSEVGAGDEFDCDPEDATNTSQACYKDCGCQTSPASSGGTGMMALIAGLVLGLRRRNS